MRVRTTLIIVGATIFSAALGLLQLAWSVRQTGEGPCVPIGGLRVHPGLLN